MPACALCGWGWDEAAYDPDSDRALRGGRTARAVEGCRENDGCMPGKGEGEDRE